MVAPIGPLFELFKIADHSISGWLRASRRGRWAMCGNHFVARWKNDSYFIRSITPGALLRAFRHWCSVCDHLPTAHPKTCFEKGEMHKGGFALVPTVSTSFWSDPFFWAFLAMIGWYLAFSVVGNKTLEAKGKVQKTLGQAQAKFGDVKQDMKDSKKGA